MRVGLSSDEHKSRGGALPAQAAGLVHHQRSQPHDGPATQAGIGPGACTARGAGPALGPAPQDARERADFEGSRYLVAPRGETEWVRNLRASGHGKLLLGRHAEDFTPVELSDPEKVPVLRAYLSRWKVEVGAFFDGLESRRIRRGLLPGRGQAPGLQALRGRARAASRLRRPATPPRAEPLASRLDDLGAAHPSALSARATSASSPPPAWRSWGATFGASTWTARRSPAYSAARCRSTSPAWRSSCERNAARLHFSTELTRGPRADTAAFSSPSARRRRTPGTRTSRRSTRWSTRCPPRPNTRS